MMKRNTAINPPKIKIPFILKFWSLWHYFRPIFWGDIEINKKWFITGIYNEVESNFDYVERLIEMGQLITLQDIGIKRIDSTTFFDYSNFEKLTTYAYWSIAKATLQELILKINKLTLEELYQYETLLHTHIQPYNIEIESTTSKEYIQSIYKLNFLKNENAATFQKLCRVDRNNRNIFLSALQHQITILSKKSDSCSVPNSELTDNEYLDINFSQEFIDELQKLRIWNKDEVLRLPLLTALSKLEPNQRFPKYAHLQILNTIYEFLNITTEQALLKKLKELYKFLNFRDFEDRILKEKIKQLLGIRNGSDKFFKKILEIK